MISLAFIRRSIFYTRIATRLKGLFPSVYFGPPEGLIPNFREWSQGQPAASRFLSLWPPEAVRLEPPCHVYAETHPAFCLEDHYLSHEGFVCDLDQVRLVGPDGYLISHDNRLFFETMWSSHVFFQEQAYALHRPRLRRLQRKRGGYATLAMPWSSWYYHWLTDVLPRLALLERLEGPELPLIVSAPLSEFQMNSLALLGVPEERLCLFDDEHWQVDRLRFPSFLGESGKPPGWALDWLRAKFLRGVDRKERLWLYISRESASHRRVVNETELCESLNLLGFRTVHAESLRFHEQIELFANAEVIVAPHGAGLTNALFATDATVIEIFAPSYVNLCYYRLSNALHHRYWYVIGGSANTASVPGRELYDDIVAPLDAVLQTLQRAGVGR